MENPKLVTIFSEKISVLDDEHTKPADSFVVDMERFSNLLERDVPANSRIKLQRSLSRKGSVRSSERKPNPNAANENPIATSPRAAPLHGASTPEKLTVVTMGATDNSPPQPHNQITIMAGGATPAESKLGGRRFSFRRPSSSPSWTIDPRRILLFFATLSSMGTMLLIYFTLSMGNLNADESVLN
ncbi:PREDICTED: uncharacterized protein LOC109165303 isoform X2 [Ipomoea nil]|uniref:uncharacterized protein LOC109165303 isoform X2 n=1 Tax=Ipomoea nil TaxID=35883 RepID=UPI0009017201|nr:PREDICTED: uncharacterized protein LOC109165303 isoform X2 [Ipomoea nil]